MFKSRGLLFIVLAMVMVFVFSALAFAQGTPSVQLADNATIKAKILTGPTGLTLYVYGNDTPGTSTCTGGCLQAWPPLTVTAGTTPTAGSGVTGQLGTLVRTDNGQTQVTINQKPLYYFGQDKAPGDAKGQNIANVWFVADAAGNPIKQAAQVTGTATATATVAATAAPTATTAPAAAAASSAVTATTAATATKSAPAQLPTTGSDSGSSLLLMVLSGMMVIALGAALVLNTARRAR
jgi:predicted lipoprotein with Yx(FWY)xxD motif